ncbi:hypothetical protein AB6M97_01895 [Streptococcus hillyeri]|uniref:hypothetical protein n=1 Tax=Streptococcus hillyeri TaxID=2282420 RepID=UPI0034E1B0A3
MAKNFLLDLAFENLSKSLGNSDWDESDEVILFSLANKEQIQADEDYRETEDCNYFGKRVCLFANQIKKNNYITLHKITLEKIIEAMGILKMEDNDGLDSNSVQSN